jgi:GNAT superfamily N-acetyltransferase
VTTAVRMRPCSPTGPGPGAPSRRTTRMPSSPCTRGCRPTRSTAATSVRDRTWRPPTSTASPGSTAGPGSPWSAMSGVPDELPPAMVAVARYEGRPGRRSAELAVVVDDVLQHQGVGRLMLGRLVDVAREAGMEESVADVLAGNAAMLGLLRTRPAPAHGERRRDRHGRARPHRAGAAGRPSDASPGAPGTGRGGRFALLRVVPLDGSRCPHPDGRATMASATRPRSSHDRTAHR